MDEMTLGKRIAKLRRDKGLTQEQLSAMLNVTPQAVSKWENDASCPDIATLPKLAEILGVTTDELLGIKPTPAAEVIDNAPRKKKKKTVRYSFNYNAGIFSSVFFGVMLVIIGTALILSKTSIWPFETEVNFWALVWPTAILGVGLSWCISDRSFFGLGIALLGLFFLLCNLGIIEYELTFALVFSAALILAGLSILFKRIFPRRGSKGHRNYVEVEDDDPDNGYNSSNHSSHTPVSNYADENGYVTYNCAFCNDKRSFAGETFYGGKVEVAFGESSLDLTGVKTVVPNSTLSVEVAFGSLVLIMPQNILIKTKHGDNFLSSMHISGSPSPDASDTIYIESDNAFSGIEVKYR